jgi:hypothetical protein
MEACVPCVKIVPLSFSSVRENREITKPKEKHKSFPQPLQKHFFLDTQKHVFLDTHEQVNAMASETKQGELMSKSEFQQRIGKGRLEHVELRATEHSQDKGHVGIGGLGWYDTGTRKVYLHNGIEHLCYLWRTTTDKAADTAATDSAFFDQEYDRLAADVASKKNMRFLNVVATVMDITETLASGFICTTHTPRYIALMERDIPCEPPVLTQPTYESEALTKHGVWVGHYVWLPEDKIPPVLKEEKELWLPLVPMLTVGDCTVPMSGRIMHQDFFAAWVATTRVVDHGTNEYWQIIDREYSEKGDDDKRLGKS